MARHPFHHPPTVASIAQETGDQATEIPPEYAITRLYTMPVGSAAGFMAGLEDDTEEPTPSLRALLCRLAR